MRHPLVQHIGVVETPLDRHELGQGIPLVAGKEQPRFCAVIVVCRATKNAFGGITPELTAFWWFRLFWL